MPRPRASSGLVLAAAILFAVSYTITSSEAVARGAGGLQRGRRALSLGGAGHDEEVHQVSFPDHPPRPPPYPPWVPTYNKTALDPSLLGAHGTFQGLKCLPFSTYPAAQCPLDGAGCLPNSTCVWWESGTYTSAFQQDTADRRDWRSDRCAASTCSSPDVPGAFEDLVWKPRTCSSAWFTPQEAFQCLKGKRVLFSGDSMLRHVFNRLIQYLRGIPDILEHYYHTNTRYTHNGTHDLFELSPLAPRHGVPKSQWNRDSVELGLLWSPKSFKVEEIVAIDPDVLVTGLIYHPSDTCKWVLPLIKATAQRIQIPGGLFWLTTPTIAPEPWKKEYRAARNAFYRETFAQRCNATSSRRATVAADNGAAVGKGGVARPGPWHIVPLDDMAAPELFLTNPQDLIHYQCRHNAHIDQPLILDDIRSPLNGDCRDLMNLNVVQVLLNQVCCPKPHCGGRRA